MGFWRFLKEFFVNVTFSDETNKAVKSVTMDLDLNYSSMTDIEKKDTIVEFADSFNETWKVIKRTEGRTIQEVNQIVKGLGIKRHAMLDMESYLKGRLDIDPKGFGMALALLAGILKFAPEYVLTVSGYVIASIKALKKYKSLYYYEFIQKRLDLWSAEIGDKLEKQQLTLTPLDRTNYETIRRYI